MNIKAQKINSSIFEIFMISLVNFQISNKFSKAGFFQKTFSLANTSIDIALGAINDQVNADYQSKKICGSSFRSEQKNICYKRGLSKS